MEDISFRLSTLTLYLEVIGSTDNSYSDAQLMSTKATNPFVDALYDLFNSIAAVHMIAQLSKLIILSKMKNMHASSSDLFLFIRAMMTPGLFSFSTLVAHSPAN